MKEGEAGGVQTEPVRVVVRAVPLVAGYHVADVRAVDAELIRPPRHRLKLDERLAATSLKHAQTRLRRLPFRHHIPFRTLRGVASDGRVDVQHVFGDEAAQPREVTLLDEAALKVL